MTRLEWHELPGSLRDSVERRMGARVADAHSQSGGFSKGLASLVRFTDNAEYFIKAVPRSSAGTFELYEREAQVLRAIPGDLPAAHLVDAFTTDDWTVLVMEGVRGRHPVQSPASEDTIRVLDTLQALSAQPARGELPRLSDELADDAGSWDRLESAGLLETSTPWCVQHSGDLQRAARRVGAAVVGDRLIHGDLRADNILIDADGRAVLIDWPWAATGAPWVDALLYLLDLRVEDPAADVTPLLEHPVFESLSREDLISLLAAIGGAWFEKCRLPAPDGMLTLRDFQRREALCTVEWIQELTAG